MQVHMQVHVYTCTCIIQGFFQEFSDGGGGGKTRVKEYYIGAQFGGVANYANYVYVHVPDEVDSSSDLLGVVEPAIHEQTLRLQLLTLCRDTHVREMRKKEGRRKQGHTNDTRQSKTTHPRWSLFLS